MRSLVLSLTISLGLTGASFGQEPDGNSLPDNGAPEEPILGGPTPPGAGGGLIGGVCYFTMQSDGRVFEYYTADCKCPDGTWHFFSKTRTYTGALMGYTYYDFQRETVDAAILRCRQSEGR